MPGRADLTVEYDEEADAVYVPLRDLPVASSRAVEDDDDRRIDYAVDGTPVGIELLNVSLGVNVAELPQQSALMKALTEMRIRSYGSRRAGAPAGEATNTRTP